MIKQRFTGFMIAVFMASLPAMVYAQFANEVKLLASDGVMNDSFGFSVSISGDTAIIGAPYDSCSGLAFGSAYVLVRNPTTNVWAQQKLLASDDTTSNFFGGSVAIDRVRVVQAGSVAKTGNQKNLANKKQERDLP